MFKSALAKVLAVFLVWAAVTLGTGMLLAGHEGSLTALLTRGPYWPAILASAFLLLAGAWLRLNDVGWAAPDWAAALRLAWLPLVFVALFLGGAAVAGAPPAVKLAWILVNTVFVGLSEEWMFRGYFLRVLLDAGSPWRAMWISSLVFGALHALNAFVTGDVDLGVIQALAAFMSGVMFCALRLRIGSLWPGIVLHCLWDFALLALVVGAGKGEIPKDLPLAMKMAPLLLVTPNFLYGLYLMRRVKPRMRAEAEREF